MTFKYLAMTWRRWLWCCIVCGFFATLLFNEFGQVLYGLSGMVLFPIASDPVKKAWCDTGNWLVDTFQPLVSDEKMIAHLQAHQADMEELAWRVVNKQYTEPEGGLIKEFELETKRLGLYGVGVGGAWPVDPYSVEAARAEKACRTIQDADRTHKTVGICRPTLDSVDMRPAFGRSRVANFCSQNTSVTFKAYRFYPGVAPKILDGRFQFGVDVDGKPVFHTTPLVPNTNHVRQDICQYRRIDTHWFISVC